MLRLHRLVHPFDFIFDSTGDILMYGDFYFKEDEPDENGNYLIIRATTYHNLKQQKKKDNWDYTVLNRQESLRDYEKSVKDAYHELVKESILEHKVWGKDSQNWAKDAGEY